MPSFYVRANDRQQVRDVRTSKGDVVPVSVDFSAWADDGGAVTTVTWSVKNGNAAISGEALASNVASAVVTTAQAGSSMVEVKGAGATHTKIVPLRIYCKDPAVATDYGWGWAWRW